MLLIPGIIGSAAPQVGDFESLQTATVTAAGGASSITFASIPSTYQHLQIRAYIRAADDWSYRLNGDSGTNYSGHLLYGNGASAIASGLVNLNRGYIGYGDTTTEWGGFVLDILDYANTNKFKTSRALAGFDRNGAGFIMLNSANWRNTNAITSIEIFATGGNLQQYSHFALYGIRG